MRLFYSATPVTLLLLFATHASIHAQSDSCFDSDLAEFGQAKCNCDDPSVILCDTRRQISEFPILNGTFPQVEEM